VKAFLNGAERTVETGTTLLDLVAQAADDPERRGIAVALEGEVVPRSRWSETRLADGARVEVLEARPGG
jgi:sulfur carrier protein